MVPEQPIDPILLNSQPMRLACAGRDLAGVYRLLQRHGISQRRIAALTGQSQSEISEILNGRKVVSYDVLVRVADGLSVPRGRFGLAYDDTTAELVAELNHTNGADGSLADDVDGKRLLARVAELTVGAATIDPTTWAPLGGSYPRPPYQVTAPDVDRLAELTGHLHLLSERDGGGVCRDVVLAHVTSARRLLSATIEPEPDLRPALHTAVAEAHLLAGSVCHDVAGATGAARRHLTRAMEHAGYLDHTALLATAICHLGVVQLHRGYLPDAVNLLHLAQASADRSRCPHTAAMVAAHLAIAYATAGDEPATLACLRRADDELHRAENHARVRASWLALVDPVDLRAMHATALARLPNLTPGQCDEAIDHLQVAIAQRPLTHRRARTLDLLTLAGIQLTTDQIVDAIATTHQAIDLAAQLRSHHVMDAVGALAARFTPHGHRDDTRALLRRITLLTQPHAAGAQARARRP